jgi:hypothetical protein
MLLAGRPGHSEITTAPASRLLAIDLPSCGAERT